jgi:hypothetical protein
MDSEEIIDDVYSVLDEVDENDAAAMRSAIQRALSLLRSREEILDAEEEGEEDEAEEEPDEIDDEEERAAEEAEWR